MLEEFVSGEGLEQHSVGSGANRLCCMRNGEIRAHQQYPRLVLCSPYHTDHVEPALGPEAKVDHRHSDMDMCHEFRGTGCAARAHDIAVPPEFSNTRSPEYRVVIDD